MTEEEKLYRMQAVVLALGYNPEDAAKRLKKMAVVDEILEGPTEDKFSHLDDPEFRDKMIKKVTRQIQIKESKR